MSSVLNCLRFYDDRCCRSNRLINALIVLERIDKVVGERESVEQCFIVLTIEFSNRVWKIAPMFKLAIVSIMTIFGTFLAPYPAVCDDASIQADRPGIADGSTVVGASRYQLEAGFQNDLLGHSHSDQQSITTPTLIRLGLSDSLELRIESNGFSNTRVSSDDQSVDKAAGYSPVSAGVKYNFIPASESNSNLSLGVIGRYFPVSGSGDFRSHHSTGDIRIAVDKEISDLWSFTGNIGAAAYEDDSSREFAAALLAGTITRTLSDKLAIFGDFGFQGPESQNGGGALLVDGGVTYLLTKELQLDFSFGSGLTGVDTSNFFWSAGLSILF
jgi:hypothetical protein